MIIKDIRRGNDIEIIWYITWNDEPYLLDGKDLKVTLNRGNEHIVIEDFTIVDNTIKFTYLGKDQKHLGVYFLTLVENDGREDMHTVDSCPAFHLVANSCSIGKGEGGSKVQIETIMLESKLDVAGGNYYISVIDNLNSDSADDALSAHQGKVLNESKQDTLVSGMNIKTINNNTLLGEGAITIKEGHDIVNNLSSTREDASLSAKQGKLLNESKQNTLVSGVNIKTINNQSILGEGNLIIEGGSSAGVTSVNGRNGAVMLTKSDVNLGNVDNTSDADKPISTAMQTALNNKVDKVTGFGLISDAEKTRLASVDNYDDTQIRADIASLNTNKQGVLHFTGVNQNIKTVGGLSLSGSGDIPVGENNVQSDWDAIQGDAFIKNKPAIPTLLSQLGDDEMHRLTTDTEKENWNGKAVKIVKENVEGSGAITKQLTPNHFYVYGAISSLTITLAPEVVNTYNEYMIQFKANASPFTLGIPNNVVWADGFDGSSLEQGKTYQLSIVNNIATILGGTL